jgi:hypothetical protein
LKNSNKKNLIDLGLSSDMLLYWVTLFFIFVVGYFSGRSYGPPVWDAVYASGQGEGQLLGNLQSIGVILIGVNFLIASRCGRNVFWLLSLTAYFYFLVIGILIRGGRLEFLSGILAIYILRKIIKGLPAAMRLRNYFFLVIAAVAMEYVGYLRTALSGVDAETFTAGLARMYENGVLFLGTISGIGSAFANVISMLDNKVIDFTLGGPYIDYILRTPPEFLYPNRPEDLSSIFEKNGYVSIGGFFEIGEQYLNFGILGVLIIPGLITFLFKRVTDRAQIGSFFHYMLLLAIVSVFMRGAWYQNFAYYKAIITGIILYLVIILYAKFIEKLSGKNKLCAESQAL